MKINIFIAPYYSNMNFRLFVPNNTSVNEGTGIGTNGNVFFILPMFKIDE